MSKTIAMIPARLGSKRVPKKNIRLLNGIPLISYIIRAAKEANCFDDIYVNSESDIIGEIAQREGVKFYKRPEQYSTDSATNDHFAHDFLDNTECETLVQLLPTSPFITPEEIRDFTRTMHRVGADTMISVFNQQIECVYNGSPINFDQKKITPPSQDLEPIKPYASGLMGWKKDNYLSNMEKYNCAYHGGEGSIHFFELSGFSTVDIDNEEDFQLAEAVARSIQKSNHDPMYYNSDEVFDADRLRVLLEDGVTNNNMFNFNKEVVSAREIIENNPTDVCWSHTLINSPSTCATLIAQMPGEGNRLHYHSEWDEWWLIMKGEWQWHVEGRDLTVKEGDVVFIERFKKHKITAIGNQQAIRLAVSREDVDHIYPGEN